MRDIILEWNLEGKSAFIINSFRGIRGIRGISAPYKTILRENGIEGLPVEADHREPGLGVSRNTQRPQSPARPFFGLCLVSVPQLIEPGRDVRRRDIEMVSLSLCHLENDLNQQAIKTLSFFPYTVAGNSLDRIDKRLEPLRTDNPIPLR